MIKEIKEIMLNNLSEQKLSKDQIEKAKTLRELGLDFEGAVKILEERNIPVVLYEEDKAIVQDKQFSETEGGPRSTGDLILVHKTNMIPKDSRIVTASESGNKIRKCNIKINGEEHEIEYKQERYVVNFAVNHEVKSHPDGNWGDTKYAIFVPWTSIPNEQIVGGLSSDIYTDGSVDIKEGYILVPKGERAEAKKNSPELRVIEYDGDRVLGYGNALVEMLGYNYEEADKWGWSYHEEMFRKILEEEKKVHIADAETEFQARAVHTTAVNASVSTFKYIYDNYDKLFKNKTDIFKAQIEYAGYGLLGGYLTEFQYINDMLEKLSKFGIETSPDFSQMIQRILDSENISKLTTESLCPNISKQSPESEYYLSEVLGKYKTKYELIEALLERCVLTSIARAKGMISKEGDFYEPDVKGEDIKSIVTNRFEQRKDNTRRI